MSQDAPKVTRCPACQKPLRWKAELAGRKVKCQCGQVFAMAAEADGETQSARSEPPMPMMQSGGVVKPPPIAGRGGEGELELDAPPPRGGAGGACASCGAAMKPGAVLCVACGFNTVTRTNIAGSDASGSGLAGRKMGSAGRVALDEEPNFKFMDRQVPIAMIIIGILITVLRAYTGMGSLTAALEADDDVKYPMFDSDQSSWPDDGGMFEGDYEEGMDEEDETEPGTTAPLKDGGKEEEKGGPEKADKNGVDEGEMEEGEIETPAPKNWPMPVNPIVPAEPEERSFNVSPLIVASVSLTFQALIMVPVVFCCVLFVANYLDVTFGRLDTVILKITAIVLGPMAVADWFDDVLLNLTMGFGSMLGWSVRVALVGVSLIKLFDLDFFEAMILMIVIAVVRFAMFIVLLYVLARMFLG